MLKFNDYLKEAALSAKQKKIAAVAGDKDKIDAADLAALRNGKKPVEEASCSGNMKKEELVGNQHKLDKNKNGKLDAHDFKLLRKEDKDTHSLDHEMEKHGDTFGHHHDSYDHDNSDVDRYYVKKQKQHVNAAEEALKKGDKKTMHAHLTHFYHLAGEAHDYAGRDEESAEASDLKHHHKKLAGKVHVNEEVELDEGRVKELAMDLKDMSHDEFHKQYGKPKSHFDPTNFKKPVEPGKGMDRARALAQRGMQSLSKEEVERIEEKLTQIDELSKKTLGSYAKKATKDLKSQKTNYDYLHSDDDAEHEDDGSETMKGFDARRIRNKEKGIDRAVSKLAKEETEQIDELSKKTLGSYVNKAAKDSRIHGQIATDFENTADKARKQSKKDSFERLNRKYLEKSWKREDGIAKAVGKLTKEEVELEEATTRKDFQMVADLIKGHESADKRKELATHHAGIFAKQNPRFDHAKFMKAAGVNEEVQQEVSPYLKATLKVMDEGKIDNLRDAQKLRQDTQSAYDKNYKPDTSHPHIQVVKGNAYGGANQKDDEGDEKPDETKEKKGRGRPTGSKSGARQKGGGHEDGGIPVHNLNLPKSYK